MDVAAFTNAISQDSIAIARLAAHTPLESDIPTCPGWKVRHLLSHLTYVHSWAAAYITTGRTSQLPELKEEEIFLAMPEDTELIPAFAAGAAALVDALRNAPDNISCWTFLDAPTPLHFWARRQCHETAVHRGDLEAVAGTICSIPPAQACDGIDELLAGFAGRRERLTATAPAAVLAVSTDEEHQAWLIQLEGRRISVLDTMRAADCTISGSASDLFFLLWNRLAPDNCAVVVQGDPRVLDQWKSTMRVHW